MREIFIKYYRQGLFYSKLMPTSNTPPKSRWVGERMESGEDYGYGEGELKEEKIEETGPGNACGSRPRRLRVKRGRDQTSRRSFRGSEEPCRDPGGHFLKTEACEYRIVRATHSQESSTNTFLILLYRPQAVGYILQAERVEGLNLQTAVAGLFPQSLCNAR